MANTIGKNAQGYGYKYTDLAHIHEWLESNGLSYYQYIEPENGIDYVMTVKIKDGKELPPLRGCRVVQATLSGKSNAAQEQGSALTYARRYSLLMAFGLATDDDDAESLTKKMSTNKPPKKYFPPAYQEDADYKSATNKAAQRLNLKRPDIIDLLTDEQREAFTFDDKMLNIQWYSVYCAVDKYEKTR